jgi:lipoate-protein ligase A
MSVRTWRHIRDGARPGALNMALDEAMARSVEGGRAVLRTYAWTRPTASFGRNEPARGLWSEPVAAGMGLEFVRRPTGGRVVLHDSEVTYTVLVPARDMGGPREAYRRINAALAEAMRGLGADVDAVGSVARPGPPAPRPDAEPRTLPLDAGPCFQSPAEGEVVAGGRKLIGSAQARVGGALLQHGSIILSGDQSRLAALNPEAAGFERPATLEELIGPVDFDTVARAVAAAMAAEFGGAWTESEVHPDELAAAVRLVDTRYGRPEWTWRR